MPPTTRWPIIFTLLTAGLVFLSAKFTWPDGDDGRYAVWALSLARGEGITNIHLPEPTPEVIVPPGLSLALAPFIRLLGEDLKVMMTISPLLLIALAWIYTRWLSHQLQPNATTPHALSPLYQTLLQQIRLRYNQTTNNQARHRRTLLQRTPTPLWADPPPEDTKPATGGSASGGHQALNTKNQALRTKNYALSPPWADPPPADTNHQAPSTKNYPLSTKNYELKTIHQTLNPPSPFTYPLIAIIALWPVFIISSAWRVHTEILYMFFTFAAFASWPSTNDRPWKAILPGLLAGAAFITRTVGLALLPAGILALLIRRQWSKAFLFTCAFFAINVPLLIRTYHATGSMLPYTKYAGGDEAGLLDKLHSLWVFATHYLFYGLPDLMFYRLFSADGLLAKLQLDVAITPMAGLIGILVAIGLLARIFKFEAPDLYFAAYFVIISSFNQADYAARGEFLFQDRYVIPIIPLAALYIARAISLISAISWRPIRLASHAALPLLALYVGATALGAGISRFRSESHYRGLFPMAPARYAASPNENDRAWGSYFASAQWLQSNAPPGAVVFCRKPQEMFLSSGHRADRYLEHGTGTNLLATISTYRDPAAYLIEDAFLPQTAFGRERIAIIEPLLNDYADAFDLVHETQAPSVRIWQLK